MPTIRIDDDVWEWLKRHARPFEDTPNSVLRRIAGLDPAIERSQSTDDTPAGEPRVRHTTTEEGPMLQSRSPEPRRPGERITGDLLNRRHRLGLRHALYHKDGTFYERLTEFPGGLCDPKGYVRYDTEQQFLNDSQLNIGQKVNVPHSLASHSRYRRFGA